MKATARLTTLTRLMSSPPKPPPLGPSQAGTVDGQGPPKIHLYTGATPNGHKVSVLLEELRAAYPELAKTTLSYDVCAIDISSNAQKHPSFLAINPNGRIPAIVDDNFNGINIWESASVELWLIKNYDKEHKLSFADPVKEAEVLNWVFFAHGGVGPMQGQSNHFFRYAPVKIPYGIKRYIEETERLYSVLESGLDSGYLVGGKFSVADINVFPWVKSHIWAGVDVRKFPKLEKWLYNILDRPATQKGLQVPAPPRNLAGREDETFADVKKWIEQAEEFNVADLAKAK